MLDIKPLEIHDYSGGLSDNFFDGGPTHYIQGDNLWITVDKNLQERNGTIILDPIAYNLPGNQTTRIAAMWTFINETILLAQSGRNICYYSPNQGVFNILGPNGVNEALGGGDYFSSVTAAEWQRHMFFASDAQCNPIKIYRDQNNAWQTRTAGLPRAIGNYNLTNDQILQKSLTLINQIRVSMVAHFQDVNLHALIDKVALNYFVAQTFNPGDELPPAGVTTLGQAVDLPSLLLLIGNVNAAYEHHRADASKNGSRVYHNNFLDGLTSNPITPTGLHVKLTNTSTPVTQTVPLGGTTDATRLTLILAASQVDDIAQKWYWHRYAIFTHSLNNDYPTINIYNVTAPKVGTINSGQPVITANLTDAFNFVNNCKYYYNIHVQDGGGYFSSHIFPTGQNFSPSLNCNLINCFDFDSYANLIFWLRILYYQHYIDAANNYYRLTTISTDASTPAHITPVWTNNPAGPPLLGTGPFNLFYPGGWNLSLPGVPPGTGTSYLNGTNLFNGGITSGSVPSLVTQGGGLSTAPWVVSLNTSYTIGGNLSSQPGFQYSFSKYHIAANSSGAPIDAIPPAFGGTWTPNVNSALVTSPDATGTDAKTWLALGSELFFVLASHATDVTVHLNSKPFNNSGNLPTPAGTFANSNVVTGSPFSYVIPFAPFFIPTVASYLYAFVFTDTYQVEPNGIVYTVQSNPILVGPVQTSSIIPPGASVLSQAINTYPNITYTTLQGVQISNLPVITNDANHNYFTTNITIDIYRTTDGGTTYFRLLPSTQFLSNGTLSYLDQTSDSVSYTNTPALNTNPPIYTTGGVVGNDQPPPSKCIATLNGFMYYANIVDTGQSFSNRIRQGLQYNPDSAPATFFDDLEDAIVGITPTRSVIVALCGRSIYRVTGNFNSLGQGAMIHEKISDKMGCVSSKSAVSTEIGVFFAGLDGFYYTDGYQLIKITIDLNTRYQNFTATSQQQSRIVGAYDRYNRRIHWTLQSNPTDTNPDVLWNYYLDYGVKPQGVFTTSSNFNYFRPASVVAFQGTIIYGHEKGYFLKFDQNTKTDPIVDTTNVPSSWQAAYIPYNYSSCALTFGTLFKRKYTTKIHWVGANVGNVQAVITSIRDNRIDIATPLAPVQYNYNPRWGDATVPWQPGNSVNPYPWEFDHKLDAWRRFPAGQLRGDLKQITITPSFSGIYRYEDWPPFCFASISGSGTSKTITIATPTGYTNIIWPLDVVNYYISFSTDNYVAQYLITAVGTNTMTVSDPAQVLTTLSNLSWVIRGYRKQQRVRIDSIVVHYDLLGDKNDQYLGPQSSGENI